MILEHDRFVTRTLEADVDSIALAVVPSNRGVFAQRAGKDESRVSLNALCKSWTS